MIRCGRPRKGEEILRRDQLLDHALQLFAEHGYGNLSLETIAREARVSLRTIYRYFGGKPELFGAVIRRYSDAFASVLPLDRAPDLPLQETLTEFGKEFLFRLTRPECVRLRAQMLAEAVRFPELAREFYSQGPERTLLTTYHFKNQARFIRFQLVRRSFSPLKKGTGGRRRSREPLAVGSPGVGANKFAPTPHRNGTPFIK
jgi:AcrR family transcriptional regulator